MDKRKRGSVYFIELSIDKWPNLTVILVTPSSPSLPPSLPPSVVLLAEDRKLCSQLKAQGIITQTLDNSGTRARSDTVPDVTVLPAKLLGEAYQYLGKHVHVYM